MSGYHILGDLPSRPVRLVNGRLPDGPTLEVKAPSGQWVRLVCLRHDGTIALFDIGKAEMESAGIQIRKGVLAGLPQYETPVVTIA